ncbi:MAG: 1-acyl-sn-glycerol-3-phosphate acyltransferase [Taibaiella sp.]|nr:1-acyl-sn-glycerol-3-phosphate acyltransferase [Taibaiella sp.]
MERFFISTYNYFTTHRRSLWLTVIGSFLLIGFLASRIKFEEDISRILPHEKKLDKIQQIFQDSRFADKLVITISQKDTTKKVKPDDLVSYADTYVDKTHHALSRYIHSIKGRTDDSVAFDLMGSIQNNLPLFLTSQDYDTISQLLTAEKLRQSLAYDHNIIASPAGYILKGIIKLDPTGMSWLGIKKLRRLQYDDHFELYDGYIITKDHRHVMLFITPEFPASATGKNTLFLQQLDALSDSLVREYPGIESSYFGAVAVSAGNAIQLRKDTLFTQGITIVLLIIFIGIYFKKKRAPLLIILPVIFGALFSLAIIALIKGHISVVALGAGSIVLGIAVNYSLHVFNHYRHMPDMRAVIKDLASPMTIGSFTTIGGFLCLLFVPSPLLNDMGLFAAFSLIGATLCSLILLPHFIVGRGKEINLEIHHTKQSWIDRIADYKPENNKILVSGIFILTIVFLFTAKKVSFENDMMRMNFMSPELKKAENKFNAVNSYTAQSVYLVAEGKNLAEALQYNEYATPAIQKLLISGAVRKTAGVGDLLLSEKEQDKRVATWDLYWTKERKATTIQFLMHEMPRYGFRQDAFSAFPDLLNKRYLSVPPSRSDIYKTGMLNDFIVEKDGKILLVTLLKIDPQRRREVYAALNNIPGITAIDKQQAANSLVSEINKEFNNIAWMTSVLVFMALLLSYGRIELTLITFIPMLISWIWILGIMGLFGIKFNIVNIILSTFIFGLGDDYSIFIMDGLLQQYKTGKKHLSSFKSSIFLSAITTTLGLGILIFAKHPSLRSIAFISIVGIGCVVLTSQVLISFLFHWLITNRVNKGRPPWTLSGWIKSAFAFTYFTAGSLLVTIAGVILLKINPFGKKQAKYIYHTLLSGFTRSLVYIMGNVKKTFLNPNHETLKEPAVIISNHQSFLDIIVSTSLNPKIILMTNKWVWNSPVFGALVKMGGYYLADDGVENSIAPLKEKVNEGYSVMIYPEGTRSPDGNMKRFHKGAFYVAEQLGLDVLPVVIHGTGYTMPKSDFLLKDGEITVQYLPRIKHSDTAWGTGYTERAKNIGKYFRDQYEKVRVLIETPSYYREQLQYNYLYKGPVLEWYLKIKIRLEKDYSLFHKLLPLKGTITDLGCGYGFLSYLLQFMDKDRHIIGVDHDDEKIAVANHCYMKAPTQQFVCADLRSYSIIPQDAFIISDVLHYLQPEEQERLIGECVSNLNENGIIIIRDGDTSLPIRQRGTALTEFFSTKALGFNKTSNKKLSFFSSEHLLDIAAKYGASVEQVDNTKYTSNVVFVLKKKPVSNVRL